MSDHPVTALPVSRIVGYGAGDLALNLMFTFCTLFLLYYYTDVLGLSATVGGAIIMAALVWEGIFDPLMGVIANRTKTRVGRYRPYILFGAPLLCLSFVAMFVPTGLAGTSLALYALGAHILFRTAYTIVGIPYISLSAEMTRSATERSKIAGARMLFALLAAMLLSGLTLPLSATFGGGLTGFFRLSLLYAGLALIILMLCYRSTREIGAGEAAAPSFAQMGRMIAGNRPLLLLLGATVIASIAGTLSGKTLIYYVKYNLGAPDSVSTALIIMTASAGLSIPFWVAFSNRFSKRLTWLTGAAISVLTLTGIFLFQPGIGVMFWMLLAAMGAGNGAFYLTFWSMVPDTVEYGEFRTGIRGEGAIYGLVSLTQKVALGLGVGLLGLLLDAIGYRPNVEQGDETLSGITILLTLAPAFLVAIVGTIIFFYPLDRIFHARLTAVLAKRAGRASTSGR